MPASLIPFSDTTKNPKRQQTRLIQRDVHIPLPFLSARERTTTSKTCLRHCTFPNTRVEVEEFWEGSSWDKAKFGRRCLRMVDYSVSSAR